jgi:hypothetical protein
MKLLAFAIVALVALALPALGRRQEGRRPGRPEADRQEGRVHVRRGKTPAEYKKQLDDVAAGQKKGDEVTVPKPPAVDLVLQLTNTSDKAVTIYVGGDPNVWTFELSGGDGAVALDSALAFTQEFRLPKAVALAPGKSHEIPVKRAGRRRPRGGPERVLDWARGVQAGRQVHPHRREGQQGGGADERAGEAHRDREVTGRPRTLTARQPGRVRWR